MVVYQKFRFSVNLEQLKALVGFLEMFLGAKALKSPENIAISYLVIRIYKRLMVLSMGIENTGRQECKFTLNAFDAAALLCVTKQLDYDRLTAIERTVVYMVNDVIR
ncbi:MAG: hypothetical protein PUK66_07200 [Bacteroidales bacterium]|uniref:hypothetical protein n=1 Tax=Porphyromonas sp. TaxID=1924944 RepID=UPI002978E7ED|nr:hypothetical protein [Porphyromonas sp.]MDD7438598.1 hypothetical protein [Bacteroidales bacterium]MDY3067854.1 hypothetical protein [Porphyromonas sp.]